MLATGKAVGLVDDGRFRPDTVGLVVVLCRHCPGRYGDGGDDRPQPIGQEFDHQARAGDSGSGIGLVSYGFVDLRSEDPQFDQDACAEGEGRIAGRTVAEVVGVVNSSLGHSADGLRNPTVQRVIGVSGCRAG